MSGSEKEDRTEKEVNEGLQKYRASLVKKLEEVRKQEKDLIFEIEQTDLFLERKNIKKENIEITSEKPKRNTYEDYPTEFSKDRGPKIVSILKKNKRAMLLSEIEDAIIEIEGANTRTIKSFWYHADKAVLDGLIFCKKVGDSNKHTYYALKEFLERKKLKEEYMPLPKTWGKFKEDKMSLLTKEAWY